MLVFQCFHIFVKGMGTIPKVAYPIDNTAHLPKFHFNPNDLESYSRYVAELAEYLKRKCFLEILLAGNLIVIEKCLNINCAV